MFERVSAVIAGLVAAALLVAGAAQAEVERLPAAGTPAFQVDVPAGWTTNRDGDGNLYVIAGDHSAVLVLNMVAADDAGAVTLDAFAATALSRANATPFSRSEAATLAGRAATAYSSTILNPSVGTVRIRLVLARLDATHIAVESELVQPNATAAQTQAVSGLVGHLAIVGG
jgi:hypothetical protein